jgi:hypothetical protein
MLSNIIDSLIYVTTPSNQENSTNEEASFYVHLLLSFIFLGYSFTNFV